LPFEHTFVVHANDGEFPRRPPTGVIFSDEERRALAERGLPLTHRELWLRRERALWRAVTRSPSVTITYRTADPNGVPLLPSLMVPEHDASEEIPRTRFTWERPFSPAHARRSAAKLLAETKRRGKPGAVAVAEPAALSHAVLAAYAECQRREGPPGSGREAGTLNPWNGELRDPWVLGELARRWGPDRVWSASQLESYAACPFIYFVQRVLRLEELEEAEEETSPLTFGGVAHTLLERFYPALLERSFPAELDEAAAELFQRIAAQVFAELEGSGDQWLGIAPLWAVTKRELQQKVAEYLAYELPTFGDWRPHLFEYRFGDDEGSVVEIEGCDVEGAPQALRLRGRIDRVDVRGAGPAAVYRILDYKSGGMPAKRYYEDGGALQIPLYMSALQRRLGAPIESGSYRSIKRRDEGGQAVWGDENFDRALRIALSIPARIRAGEFEPQAAYSLRKWSPYWPGLDVCRVKAVYKEGCRFDES
jgi:RecB family exonuclease